MNRTEMLIFALVLMVEIFGFVLFFIGAVLLHINTKKEKEHEPKMVKKGVFAIIDYFYFRGFSRLLDKMIFKEKFYKEEYRYLAIGAVLIIVPLLVVQVLGATGYIKL